jgi:23S rRNA (cytidine1920-2'-O)/16S rRNA (cytidine1409-2'-O)-methyltransferase
MKCRLDQLLLDRDLVADLKEARARILAGEVIVEERRLDKCGQRVASDARVRLRSRTGRVFVSRGGQKLDHALTAQSIVVKGEVCLDLGASTGGFTDCLLRRGASRVYAVDVGYGLLDWRLRTDDRVVNLERTHAGQLTPVEIPEPIDLVCADLSFTSLENIIRKVTWCLHQGSIGAFLIKPQFEAEKHEIGRGGIVTDSQVHQRVCRQIQDYMEALGFIDFELVQSPIKGAKGNTEFILLCGWPGATPKPEAPDAKTDENGIF